MAKHDKSDDELTEAEFIDKYMSSIVTLEYVKARYRWVTNPTKENWLLSCEAYAKTKAKEIYHPAQTTLF